MQCCDLILATGGPGMVKAAYSSGKPAIGVGSGNVPVVVDESADIKMTVASILSSKSFDNGMICASEQAVIVYRSIYMQFKQELLSQGAYILNTQQTKAVGKIILINGSLNPQIVGQSPSKIATMAKIKIPSKTRILVGEVSDHSINEPFAHEKLSPVLALYQSQDFNHSVIIAKQLLNNGGLGHTASLFIDPNSSNQTKIDY
jgi:acetaldehyde dehydrogenase/alcohol dehydrogenase